MFPIQVRHVSWLFFATTPIVFCRFIDNYGRGQNNKPTPSDGVSATDALFLTPYIEKGQIEKGQNLAIVPPMLKDIESFAGYLTVNKTTSSNLFFWLFKSQQGKWEERPLVIWLQGGPGSSSLFGLFTEIGPFSVTKNQKLKRRKYSWNQKYNLVFFDNPVGAGFSFTKMDSGYARDESDVARDFYEALVQFYKLFPVLQKNKLIITGESYAGKYIPAIAYKIYKTNKVSPFKINLAGLMLGNAITDPVSMVSYSSYVYTLGLIDENLKEELMRKEDLIRSKIRAGEFLDASKLLDEEINTIQIESGLKGYYDFVHDDVGTGEPELQFINDPKNRKAIHVGDFTFNDGMKTYDHLENDIPQSVKPLVEELLTAEEFRILFYNGQLDIIVAYILSVDFYNTLKWPYANDYYTAKRCQFKVSGDVAGYYKTAGTFTEVLIRNAAHMVPTSQPKWAFELMDRFISDSSSFKCR